LPGLFQLQLKEEWIRVLQFAILLLQKGQVEQSIKVLLNFEQINSFPVWPKKRWRFRYDYNRFQALEEVPLLG